MGIFLANRDAPSRCTATDCLVLLDPVLPSFTASLPSLPPSLPPSVPYFTLFPNSLPPLPSFLPPSIPHYPSHFLSAFLPHSTAILPHCLPLRPSLTASPHSLTAFLSPSFLHCLSPSSAFLPHFRRPSLTASPPLHFSPTAFVRTTSHHHTPSLPPSTVLLPHCLPPLPSPILPPLPLHCVLPQPVSPHCLLVLLPFSSFSLTAFLYYLPPPLTPPSLISSLHFLRPSLPPS